MRNLLSGLIFFCATSIIAQNGIKNFIDQNYIEVIGKSELEIIPDLIYLKVIISEKDTKNKISILELESTMIEKLKEIGIDIEKELFIKDISSNFKYYVLSKNEILLTKEYQILVHNSKTASQVFQELEKIGISNVIIERLDNSKIVQFRNEVKVKAIKSAKEKAELFTSELNQNIGRALYIQEIENFNNSRPSNSILIRGVSTINKSTPTKMDFDFEKIKIESSIMCRFELK